MKFLIDPKDCLSTHGGSGYAPGSFMDGDSIICGMCGTKIENPPPTGFDKNGNPCYGNAVSGQKSTQQIKMNVDKLLERKTLMCLSNSASNNGRTTKRGDK
jgi:hypothetical protein